jgi:hypothetical protein
MDNNLYFIDEHDHDVFDNQSITAYSAKLEFKNDNERLKRQTIYQPSIKPRPQIEKRAFIHCLSFSALLVLSKEAKYFFPGVLMRFLLTSLRLSCGSQVVSSKSAHLI